MAADTLPCRLRPVLSQCGENFHTCQRGQQTSSQECELHTHSCWPQPGGVSLIAQPSLLLFIFCCLCGSQAQIEQCSGITGSDQTWSTRRRQSDCGGDCSQGAADRRLNGTGKSGISTQMTQRPRAYWNKPSSTENADLNHRVPTSSSSIPCSSTLHHAR